MKYLKIEFMQFLSKKKELLDQYKSFIDEHSLDISFEEYLIYVNIRDEKEYEYADNKLIKLTSALLVLCTLKDRKDKHGEDEKYLSNIEDAWDDAFEAIGRAIIKKHLK
jgi:hypothetical protein